MHDATMEHPEGPTSMATCQISKLAFHAPPFWPNDVELRISQLEDAFGLAEISRDKTKFQATVTNLDQPTFTYVENIKIAAPPWWKARLLQRLSQSIQANTINSTPNSGHKGRSRSISETSLSKLAEMAENILEATLQTVSAVDQPTTGHSAEAHRQQITQIQDLHTQIKALKSSMDTPHNRFPNAKDPTRNTKRNSEAYCYHIKFVAQARKCPRQCNFKPFHLIPKKDGLLRPCGDYRKLNAATIPDRYSVSNIMDFVSHLHASLLSLCNAAQIFQWHINKVPQRLDFAYAYIDDILIASDSDNQHVSHLQQLSGRLRDYGLTINKTKCIFGQTSVKFLGFIITNAGILLDPQRVQAIKDIPIPDTVGKLQPFLGMFNFYQRCLSNVANIQAPLYAMVEGHKIGIKHFRHLLEGRQFPVYMNHKHLAYAFQKYLDKALARKCQHLDFNGQFTTKIRHLSVCENVPADFLSRVELISHLQPYDLKSLAKAQAVDKELQALLTLENRSSLQLEKTKPRPFVPASCRRIIFSAYHNLSHPGVRATTRMATAHYVWPAVKKDCALWTHACHCCQVFKTTRHTRTPLRSLVPRREVQDIIAKTVANAFISVWISRFGVPSKVTTDQDRSENEQRWRNKPTIPTKRPSNLSPKIFTEETPPQGTSADPLTARQRREQADRANDSPEIPSSHGNRAE
ncbi:hypothetical protein LAZ67_14003460 [Cordylochernes scorpioides]|uniref:RNA-directed DNA polymerase n=1 Tax=Cordylochernes scorpioides TaxID=51811 RepID=A0ABY6L7N5_9ARAC|nr:hypothetical protein LAZ67_14003460 [Cordylochernes scorpioides]